MSCSKEERIMRQRLAQCHSDRERKQILKQRKDLEDPKNVYKPEPRTFSSSSRGVFGRRIYRETSTANYSQSQGRRDTGTVPSNSRARNEEP